LTLNVPVREGDYMLKATATADQSVRESATVSRRMVRVARAMAAK
jgi:hypothetical protein